MKTLYDLISKFGLIFYKATRQGDSKNPLNEIVFNFKSCSDDIMDKLQAYVNDNGNTITLRALHPFQTDDNGDYQEKDLLLSISLKPRGTEYSVVNPISGASINKKTRTNSISLIEEVIVSSKKDLNNRLSSMYDSMTD